MVSFTNPNVEYHTTADYCDCKDRTINHAGEPAYTCKHMLKTRRDARKAAGLPTTVTEARAARIARNREKAAGDILAQAAEVVAQAEAAADAEYVWYQANYPQEVTRSALTREAYVYLYNPCDVL